MNKKNKIPVEQISKLADDIRTIENFAENHNFDSGLLTAKIKPNTSNNKIELDWPLISMLICFALILISFAVILFFDSISEPAKKFMLLINLVLVILSSISAHRKFDNNIITIIAVVGGVIVVLIGAEILTPKEAVDSFKEITK